MKKLMGAIITTSALATGVVFAGGHVPPAECVKTVPDWGGFKLGAQLGYAHIKNDGSVANANGNSLKGDFSADGVIGGIHAGWDYQWDRNWIVGLEAFFDFSGADGSVKDSPQADSYKYEQDWTVGVMARAGYVMEDSLLYVGLGWAGSRFEYKGTSNGVTAKDEEFLNGLRLAVGAAQRFDRILVGVEGAYTWYEDDSTSKTDATNGKTTTKIKPRVLEAKLKVSYML